MSIDKSLRRKGGLTRTRCVLKRSERILKMLEDGKFAEGQSPFGLPKTRVQKVVLKKKAKKEEAAGEAGAAGAAGATAAAPAAEAKGAAKK
jgi:small basic protein (TIGR04137 family)